MPKFLEDDLRAEARKKGFTGRKLAQYVYGGMNNMGAMHGNKETAKGAAMQKKHDKDMKLTPASASRIRKKASKMMGY